VVICLERGADLHMAQLMPLPLTVSCFSKIHIGFTFLVPAHPGSPGKRAVKWVCVCLVNYSNSLSLQFVLCIFTTHYIQLYFTIVLHLHHHHHRHLFAQYAEMNSKICNVPDRKANSFSSNNCP